MSYVKSSKSEYRADIDGIRSLAVLSVFFFHLQPNLLPGGFLGVDVFFVISGYLITGIVLRQNHLGTFSFSHFYARRIKRIFPALFVVLLLSALVATFLLPPDIYADFMASARYASGQFANFFFARDVSYFSEGFSGQPLLHTWSLGVEEQFYLFWPLLIYFCFWVFSKNTVLKINLKIAGVMLVLSVLSFMACYSLAISNHNLAFYMFYTRALEFCLGGIIALGLLPVPAGRLSNTFTGGVGVLLLFYSFFFIEEEYLGLSFLQFGVLVPCIATALIIQTNWQSGLVNKLLATKVPVYIGRISYSLYLYHWPVIIFWKIFSDADEISFAASIGIIAVSFILSILSYLFVEQPARNATMTDRRTLVLGVVVVVVCALSFRTLENHETAAWRITSFVNKSVPTPLRYSPECHKEKRGNLDYYQCSEERDVASPIIALVGDSHSPHFLNSTTVWGENKGYDVAFYGLAACPVLLGDIHIKSSFGKEHEVECRQLATGFQSEIIEDPKIEIVLIALRFDLFHTGIAYSNRKNRLVTFLDSEGRPVKDHTEYFTAQLANTVEAIRNSGKQPIIVKQVPIFENAKDCDWEPYIDKLLGKERVCGYTPAFLKKWQQPSIDFINEFIAEHQVKVIDPIPFFGGTPLHSGVNLYKDSDHLNEYGEEFLVPYLGRALDKLLK